MRSILYISPSSGIGGVETFLRQLCKHSDKSQFQNIFLLFDKGPLFNDLKKLGAEVLVLPRRPRLSKPKDWLFVYQQIGQIIDRYNIDLVHSSQSYAALFASSPSRGKKKPHIWFQHGPTSGWMDQLASTFYHQGIISNSNFTAKAQSDLERIVKVLVPRNRKNKTILLGTETPINEKKSNTISFRKRLLDEYKLPHDTSIVSMLCRIQHWKGPHLAVEAFEKLQAMNLTKKTHLFVWGEAFKGDQYFTKLIRSSKTKKLPISFPGTTDSASQVLAASDLLINASVEAEPFGLSIIEAMSVGTPPIVPEEGGPKEIVKDGINGLFFTPRCSTSLAKGLKKFLSNADLQKKLSEGALNSAKNDFRIEQTIAKLEEYHLSFVS